MKGREKSWEAATKRERLSWIGRQQKTVEISLRESRRTGRDKGIVYEYLVFGERVLRSLFLREMEFDEVEAPREVPDVSGLFKDLVGK